jgi:hypothetical protein
MKKWWRRFRQRFQLKTKSSQIIWEYKVVQMISQSQVSPDEISRKLGGSLSAESLKAQFPEYYADQNGRAQICDFLNNLGRDGWELIQVQQVAALPLMIFKRQMQMKPGQNQK